MKRDKHNVRHVLERYLGRYGEPSLEEMESAVKRVGRNLNPEISRMTDPPALGFRVQSNRLFPIASAAAVAIAIIIGSAVLVRSVIPEKPSNVIAELSDGNLIQSGPYIHPKEQLRSGAGGAVIALADTSRVEVRDQSELMFEPAGDGIRIHLYKGGVIVNAAGQRAGHLYVQTKDLIASVVGTVSWVSAEERGSRVAAIQGEVQVEQNAAAKKLIPGQQVATSPSMEWRPVSEEISWSRNAEEHLALLQESVMPARKAVQPAPRLEFSAVSIKPLTAAGMKTIIDEGGAAGLGCHGIDGISRAAFGVPRGAGAFDVPQGSCIGVAVDLAWLVTYAYETPWRYGPNVPDWARSGDLRWVLQPERFLIEASAADPATATVAQLRQMLQTMLADRFKMNVHRETQEVQSYALVLAQSGPKLKEATGELEPPYKGPKGIEGKSSLDELAQYLPHYLMLSATLGYLDGPFINKTGLTGIYEYEFGLSCPTVGPRGGCVPAGVNWQRVQVPTGPERASDIVARLSDGMEAQLGIRLQSEKITAEVVVIDQVERPSPN